jgi:hypothetical protein
MFKLTDKRQLTVWVIVFLLAVCTLYSLLYIANSAGVSFFLLVKRGMTEFGLSQNLVSNDLDSILWSSSLLTILAFLCYGVWTVNLRPSYRLAMISGLICLAAWVCLVIFSFLSIISLVLVTGLVWFILIISRNKILPNFGIIKTSIAILIIAFFIELLTLSFYSFPMAFYLTPPTSSPSYHLNLLELSFSNLAYPFLPILYLLFISTVIVAYIFKIAPHRFAARIKMALQGKLSNRLISSFGTLYRNKSEPKVNQKLVLAVLVLAIVLSILFVIFTLLPSSNPTNMLVSVDAPAYNKMITHMRTGNVDSAFSYAFANDRTTYLLLAYSLSFVFGQVNVIQFSAALLISLFCVVIFFAMRFFVKLPYAGLFAILMVPFSFQGLGLIYAGYFANMLALILVFIFFIALIKVGERPSSAGLLSLFCLSVLILFSHSWTWYIFALSLVGFLLLEWRDSKRARNLRFTTIVIGGSIGVGLLTDLTRNLLSPISSTASVYYTAHSSLSFPHPNYIFSGFQNTIDSTLGGVFSNQLLLLLSFAGLIVLLRYRSKISNLLLSWIVIACLPILFASANFVFDRSLFLIPFAILAGLGLSSIVGFFTYQFREMKKSVLLGVIFLIFSFVVLASLNFALRYIFNIIIL